MNWGKEAKAGDAASRSIMKAFAWRAFAMINTLIISLFFAKNVKVGAWVPRVRMCCSGGGTDCRKRTKWRWWTDRPTGPL